MSVLKSNRGGNLPIIGATEWVDVGNYHKIPAKTDTGATSSAIWASHIKVTKDGTLKFQLFDEGSKYYTGRVFKRSKGNYKVALVRSSNGTEQIRYRVYLRMTIAGKKIRVLFALSDRVKNTYPILIGRRTISGKFLVDPAIQNCHIPEASKSLSEDRLSKELDKNPFKFHQKYVINRGRRQK